MFIEILRKAAKAGRQVVGVDEHARVFNRFYRDKVWDTGSGPGSDPETTAAYREFLTAFLKKNIIRSVVDVGCGDWQFSRMIDWTGVDYTGVDVSGVVLQNTKKFAKPHIRFLEMNGLSSNLPSADLLILKDVIQHWSNDDIRKFIPSLSKFKYALITCGSCKARSDTNSPIRLGQYRAVDLSAPPFSVEGDYVFEFYADEPKHVFLWSADTRQADRGVRWHLVEEEGEWS